MKKIVYPLAALLILGLSAFKTLDSINWKVADGYAIEFDTKNAKGVFADLKGEIKFDANNLGASSFNMTVATASINTGSGMKNKHAKSEGWFNVEKHANITFKSDNISKTDAGYTVNGKMTIGETTKDASIPFSFSNNTFKGSLTINRVEYNLGPTKGMQGKNAGKDIKVSITVPVTQ